jgi:dihydroneopterin aldolase
MSGRVEDLIRISGLEVDCILGVRPLERRRAQRVRLDLELEQDLTVAARSGRIQDTVDYSRLAEQVERLLKFREYRLLEEASEEIAAMIVAVHPRATAVRVALEKPSALPGSARSASVGIRRTREHFPVESVRTAFGQRSTILTTSEAELCLLSIEPGGELEPLPPQERPLEWLVAGRLVSSPGGAAVRATKPRTVQQGCICAGETPAIVFRCATVSATKLASLHEKNGA